MRYSDLFPGGPHEHPGDAAAVSAEMAYCVLDSDASQVLDCVRPGDSRIARVKYPFDDFDETWKPTEAPPLLSPKMVTLNNKNDDISVAIERIVSKCRSCRDL